MVSEIGLVDVNVLVKGKAQPIKMEKGVTFENNGGKYLVNEKGSSLYLISKITNGKMQMESK